MFKDASEMGGAVGRARSTLGELRNMLAKVTTAFLEHGVKPEAPLTIALRHVGRMGDGTKIDRVFVGVLDVEKAAWATGEGDTDGSLSMQAVESAAEVLRITGTKIEAGFILPEEHNAVPASKVEPWKTPRWRACWTRVLDEVVKQPLGNAGDLVRWRAENKATKVEDFTDIWFRPKAPDACFVYQHTEGEGYVFTVVAVWSSEEIRWIQIKRDWYLSALLESNGYACNGCGAVRVGGVPSECGSCASVEFMDAAWISGPCKEGQLPEEMKGLDHPRDHYHIGAGCYVVTDAELVKQPETS